MSGRTLLTRFMVALALACLSVPARALADEGHVSISNLKVGLICGSGDSARVCFQTSDIQMTGEGRCTFNHQEIACTWYGLSFDYELPHDEVELNCNWSSNVAADLGTPAGLGKSAARADTFKLVLKGRSGHYFNPQYTGFGRGDPSATEEMRESCQYNGATIYDVVFRLHWPEEPIVGKSHYCAGSQESNSGVEGIATVGFQITTRGDIADPALIATSGDGKQDAISLRCVGSWHYRPALMGKNPIEVPWKVDIAWNPTIPPELTRRLDECARSLRTKSGDHVDGVTEFAIA
jgi:hypothetical protein